MNIIRYKEKASGNRSQRSRIEESRHLPPDLTKKSPFNPFNKYTFHHKKEPLHFRAEELIPNQNDRVVGTGHIQDFWGGR